MQSLILRSLLVSCLNAVTRVTASRVTSVHSAQRVYAVSKSQVLELCSPDVIQTACQALGTPDQDAKVTVGQLGSLLSLTDDEVESMLDALGLEAGSITVPTLCSAAVYGIPSVLHVAAPRSRDMACTDEACEGLPVNVSMQAMLQSPPQMQPETEVGNDVIELPEDIPEDVENPVINIEDSTRLLLHVAFGIFPASNLAETDQSPHAGSGMQISFAEVSVNATNPSFGDKINSTRHGAYMGLTATAIAWTSSAVRNMDRAKVIKWFRADKTVEVRRMLTRALQALGSIHFMKDSYDACSKQPFVAYVVMTRCGKRPERFVSEILEGSHRMGCGQFTLNARYVVNICEKFWEVSDVFRSGTIAHEATHHFATRDLSYSIDHIRKGLSVVDNLNNAATYAYYVADVNGHPDYKAK